MMHRRFRLRQPADFARLRKVGRAHHHHLMLLSAAPNDLPNNRYGFITSKAVGNAVDRNRVRRQLREVIRLLHPCLKPGYDIVIVAKKPVVGQPFQHIVRITKQLVLQASLLVEGQEPC